MTSTRFIDLKGLKHFLTRLKQYLAGKSPSRTSELDNDIGALLTADVGARGNMHYIGSVVNYSDLPDTAQTYDVCKVIFGNCMIYDGEEWIDLFVDPDIAPIEYTEIRELFEGVST